MLADHILPLDNHQGRAQVPPILGEPDPEETITGAELRALSFFY